MFSGFLIDTKNGLRHMEDCYEKVFAGAFGPKWTKGMFLIILNCKVIVR